MSKKTLFLILILPFALAISFFAVSEYLVTKVKADIQNISWEYKNNEAYALSEGEVLLDATPILADGEEDVDATLTWEVKNLDEGEDAHASIRFDGENYYLVLESIGNVLVSVTNSSGNISKSFNVKIYEGGVVQVNTKRLRSQNSIEGFDYYGEYDFLGTKEIPASFYLDVTVKPIDVMDYITIETSSNVEYNELTGKVTILSSGDAYIRYKSLEENYVETEEYDFKVIKDGYNVYNYNDLLNCTNKSEAGKIVCLQANLESFHNTYNSDLSKIDEVTELFGNYNPKTKKYSFNKEVYHFESTYNTNFIDQYNEKNSDKISKELIAGIHIQKDFYGNGYIINEHNLTYPTKTLSTDDYLVALGEDDLFRGPLPYVIIGTNGLPIIKAYGQDNVGFYVDGDNITLRDVYFKNCNYSSTLENNDYTGTVVELNGDNIKVLNSHLTSGRVVLRSYSNKNTIIENTLMEKGREFIARIGSNEFVGIDTTKQIEFSFKGQDYSYSYDEFFIDQNKDNWNLNRISAALLKTSYVTVNEEDKNLSDSDRLVLARILNGILSDTSLVMENNTPIYKNEITFRDCVFYQSGLFSIGLDTIFNGPYMFDGSPVKGVLQNLQGDGLVIPNKVSGTNYPSILHLEGETEFYDYKSIDQVNLSCLIDTTYLNQTINDILGSQQENKLTIDDFFPVKIILDRRCKEEGYYYTDSGTNYVNTPFALFGGGINPSLIDTENLSNKDKLIQNIKLDIYEEVLTKTTSDQDQTIVVKGANVLKKCVPMALGFEPFDLMTYKDGYLFNEAIPIQKLKDRAQ